jgi:hypothetical protein
MEKTRDLNEVENVEVGEAMNQLTRPVQNTLPLYSARSKNGKTTQNRGRELAVTQDLHC